MPSKVTLKDILPDRPSIDLLYNALKDRPHQPLTGLDEDESVVEKCLRTLEEEAREALRAE